ncbi:MAG: retroviral-like aspartic protease family protein [Defluviitaleaceae bacterium]|nr:retroviral-like aspartic protease family protein [Defluviitaleaceae bacterium]
MCSTKIDFSEYSRVYVTINFKPHGKTTMLPDDFKVDTGADFSTVSKGSLYDLGYDSKWIYANLVDKSTGTITTASGDEIKSALVQLPIINILGYEAKNWPFLIALDDDKDFRNLLGRDLLSGFNYSFNNDNKVFEIARAKSFEFILSKFPNQEIHDINI